jgi:hypothetical protein
MDTTRKWTRRSVAQLALVLAAGVCLASVDISAVQAQGTSLVGKPLGKQTNRAKKAAEAGHQAQMTRPPAAPSGQTPKGGAARR